MKKTSMHPEAQSLMEEEYWRNEHEKFPAEDWVYAVKNGDTRLGYWEWLSAELFAADEAEK